MRSKSHQNKFMRILTSPIRFLKKGRDLYVRSMMDFAYKPSYSRSSMTGSVNKGQQAPGSGLPKSFSTSVASSWSSNFESEDLRELIRASSTTASSENNKLRGDMELYLKQMIREQQMKQLQESLGNINTSRLGKGVVPRSSSVGMGKIDEEKPFDEGEEEEDATAVKKIDVMYPRSRSHAVGKTNAVF